MAGSVHQLSQLSTVDNTALVTVPQHIVTEVFRLCSHWHECEYLYEGYSVNMSLQEFR